MTDTSSKLLSGIITGILAFTFLSGGVVKVTPMLSKELHEHMQKEFVEFAKKHPGVHFGYKIDPAKYMIQIGLIECIGAVVLLVGPKVLKLFSCMVLSSVMVGAVYTLYSMEAKLGQLMVPALVLLLLFLKMHFLISITSQRRTKAQKEEKKEQ